MPARRLLLALLCLLARPGAADVDIGGVFTNHGATVVLTGYPGLFRVACVAGVGPITAAAPARTLTLGGSVTASSCTYSGTLSGPLAIAHDGSRSGGSLRLQLPWSAP